MDFVRRRQFLISAGASLAGPPIQAQVARKLPRIGFVLTTAPLATMVGAEPTETVMRGFVHGLRALGYVEGQNIVIERRSAEGKLERLEELIQELVKVPVNVLVVSGTQMVQVAKKITTTVPVVVAGMGTPVELGIVSSLARPGGNITGLVTAITPEFDIKRLELIREMLPKASRIAFLGMKEEWTSQSMDVVRAAAKEMGLTLVLTEVQMPRIEAALESLELQRPDALLVSQAPPFFVHRKLIVEFVARIRVPDFHRYYQAVEVGALASYGHDAYDVYRRAAGYVVKILEGARPSELPIEQMERYALVLNLSTAKALGIKVPQVVLLRADRVIE